jgi:hypothetical protein
MRRYIAKPVRKKLDDLEKVLMLHIDDTNHNLTEHAAMMKNLAANRKVLRWRGNLLYRRGCPRLPISKIISSLNNLIETPPKQKPKIGFNAG